MRGNNSNKLTTKEQKTTTAYKMMSGKINVLEKSLKKSQDELEKIRVENHELDKKVVLLENQLKNNRWMEFFKFISTAGMGFSINYFTSGITGLGLSIGISSAIIYIVCIIKNK